MREKNGNNMQETDAAFVLSLALMNILILVVISVVGWVLYLAVSSSNDLTVFFRGGILP
jgi:hypothetical protein